MKILIMFFSLVSIASAGTITCKKEIDGLDYEVVITDSRVTISSSFFSKPRVFENLKHANGLITDYGLAIYSEDHFGCIRNVLVITDYREPFNRGDMKQLSFGTCAGGSTRDELCLRHADKEFIFNQ